jgi:predicted dienelactone hydrolase
MSTGMRAVTSLLLCTLALPAGAASDPASPGSLAIGVTTVDVVDASRNRTLVTEVWYPARIPGRDARVRGGRRPLVIVVHGHCGSRTNYTYLTTHLASRGYLVAAPDLPRFCATRDGVDVADPPQDLVFLHALLHDRTGSLAAIARHVRGRTTGLVGHSLGGAAVLQAARAESAFSALVALAPVAGRDAGLAFTGLRPARAVLVMGGSADTTISFDLLTKPFFDALPPPAFLVRITGGTHRGFTDVDSSLTPEALAAQETIVERYATAFFDRYLRDRRPAARWLRDTDDGMVEVTAKTR